MMLTYEIVDIPGWGYGYSIESADGSIRIFQRFKPGIGGKVRMTKAEAEDYAKAFIAEYEAASAQGAA